MDDFALRQRVAQQGPRLTHWVARVPNVHAGVARLAAQDVDRGAVLQASRMTAHGMLQWQITVRPDGQRLFDGCMPTLIQWGSVHPTDGMPDCGVALQCLRVQHPQADMLRQGLQAMGLTTIPVANGPALLSATLQTPKGLIEIHT